MRRKDDKRWMPRRDHMQVPFGSGDVSGVSWTRQDFHGRVTPERSSAVLREGGMLFEKLLHFCRGFKQPRGITFQALADDRRDRLVEDEDFTLAPSQLIFVPNGTPQTIIAVLRPGPHPADCLPRVSPPMMLVERCLDILRQLAFGIVADFKRGRFENAACFSYRFTESQVDVEITRQAREIVDDDDVGFLLLAQESEHVIHTGALEHFAGYIVLKNADELIAAPLGIFPRCGRLPDDPMTVQLLVGPGDAAVSNAFL